MTLLEVDNDLEVVLEFGDTVRCLLVEREGLLEFSFDV